MDTNSIFNKLIQVKDLNTLGLLCSGNVWEVWVNSETHQLYLKNCRVTVFSLLDVQAHTSLGPMSESYYPKPRGNPHNMSHLFFFPLFLFIYRRCLFQLPEKKPEFQKVKMMQNNFYSGFNFFSQQ